MAVNERQHERQPFVVNSPMTQAMAVGHRARKGHELVAYYAKSRDDEHFTRLIRTCCKED